MKSLRLTEVGELAVHEVPKPVPGPGEVLVRIEAAGICGSDRHMFRGEFPTVRPVTLGHEFCGRVEAVGEGVERIAPGMLVTGDPNIFCGTCPACRAGRVNLCDTLSALGVHRDGGFADYAVMPEAQAYELPSDLDPRHGAFCEPLACCLHALDIARIRPGDSVAVLGGGVIGLLMVQLARLAGATTLILSTRQAGRRALAEKLGATHSIDPSAGDAVAAAKAISPGGMDVVLECAGVPDTVTQSLAMARRGGTVVIFGVTPAGQEVSIVPFDILTKELRIESAWLNPLTHRRAATMIASGVLDLDSLVTRTVSLEEAGVAISGDPQPGEIKLVATPNALH